MERQICITENEEFRITYTGRHTVDETQDTIGIYDRIAVEILSASYYCEILANEFATNQSSLIQADSVDHENKSQAFARRAEALRKLYLKHMGLPEDYGSGDDGGSVPAWCVGTLERYEDI